MSDFYPVPDRSEWRTIILAPYGEDPLQWTFHVATVAARGGRTKIFPKRATVGPTDFDRDDTLSTANFGDLSGGSGIAVIKPSTDTGKTWWHVADLRGTDGWACAPEAIMRQPEVYTGDHVPLGRIGSSTYGLWGTAIHRWIPESQSWSAAAATIGTVVNTEGIVTFNDRMYFPLGSTGYSYVAESSPGTLTAVTTVAGAATPPDNDPIPTSNPRVHAFAVHQEMLWAITTAAEGHTLANSTTGTTGAWTWPYNTARPDFVKISTSTEPHTLIQFQNTQQEKALWAVSRRGCLIWDPTNMCWQESNLWDVPPHPDFGKCAKVFRPGEAVWIAGGGGDLIQYQSNGTVVPAAGPGGAGDGMPPGKRGSVVSMASDLANLLLLVQGETAIGASDDLVDEEDASDPISIPPDSGTTSVIAWTGKGFHPLWESAEEGGSATKIVVSDATDDAGNVDYRTFWGTGEESWSMPSKLTTYSSRQAVELGNLWRFRSDGYIEWGEFNGGTAALKKWSSHVGIYMHKASALNFVQYDYQTDAHPYGTWTTLGNATTEKQETILPFGLTDDLLFSEGISWRWIKQKLWFHGTGGFLSPVVGGMSLAYMPLPGDAATKTYSIGLPQDVDPLTHMTREQIMTKLESHVSSERALYLKHLDRTYRCYVASVADTGMVTGDAWGIVQLTVIQIPTGVPALIGEL